MTPQARLIKAKVFLAKVETDLGYIVTDHLIDLFFDNAETLAFSDDDCLEAGNAIYAERGIKPVPKWWT